VPPSSVVCAYASLVVKLVVKLEVKLVVKLDLGATEQRSLRIHIARHAHLLNSGVSICTLVPVKPVNSVA
jgi:hypothetical protein